MLAVAALAAAGNVTAAPLRYGVADDWPKFHACGDVWWQSATDIGYQEFRMTVQWNEATPTVIPFQANIQAAIDCAKLNNLEPILAVYPQHPAAIGSNAGAQAQFATFVSLVGQAFPGVKDIIVGNEPNVNRFWQPQYRGGQDAAATDDEHTLAQSYDALKIVRPDAIVWGPAISSRGNDHANATSNPSHSPVWFIKYLGDAYRAAGRTKPIFDEFDMHPTRRSRTRPRSRSRSSGRRRGRRTSTASNRRSGMRSTAPRSRSRPSRHPGRTQGRLPTGLGCRSTSTRSASRLS
jgi:hypothetical protein